MPKKTRDMSFLKNNLSGKFLVGIFLAAAVFSIWNISAFPQDDFEGLEGKYIAIYDSTYIWPDGSGGYDYYRYFFSEVELAEKGRNILSTPATPILDKDDIIDLFAFTKSPTGELLVADSADIARIDMPNGQKRFFVNFRRPEPGAKLYLEWTLKSNQANIAGQRFIGRTVPVDSATIVITFPDNWVFNFRVAPEINLPSNKVYTGVSKSTSLVSHIWSVRNLGSLIKEEFAPPVERLIPSIYFSFKYDKLWSEDNIREMNWNVIARFYGGEFNDFIKDHSILDNVADSIKSIDTSAMQMAKSGFKWLTEHFRTINPELKFSKDLDETLEKGRATQAEAASILFGLFSKLGINCKPFLASSRKVGNPLIDVPALFWFDRILIASYINGDTIWTDPFYLNFNFTLMPFEDQGVYAMDIGKDGGNFIITATPDYRDNGMAVHMKLDIDSLGAIEGAATEVYSGAMIAEISSYMASLDPAVLKTTWEKSLAKSFPGVKIGNFITLASDSIGQTYRIGYSFTTSPLVRPYANRAYFPIDILGRWKSLPILPSLDRIFPIEINRPRFELERITLNIAPSFEIEYLPENYSMDNYLGELYSVVRQDSRSVTITKGLGLKKSELPPSAYTTLQKFFNKARAEADKQIILKKVD